MRPAAKRADDEPSSIAGRRTAGIYARKDDDGNDYIVGCTSRSLNKHERNYSSFDGEMLALVYALRTFRHYLMGREFKVISDHRPLRYLMQHKQLNAKHQRWRAIVQDYSFTVEHRAGKLHNNADVLSRWPRRTTED